VAHGYFCSVFHLHAGKGQGQGVGPAREDSFHTSFGRKLLPYTVSHWHTAHKATNLPAALSSILKTLTGLKRSKKRLTVIDSTCFLEIPLLYFGSKLSIQVCRDLGLARDINGKL